MKRKAVIFSLSFTAMDHLVFWGEGILDRLVLRGYGLASALSGALNDVLLRIVVLQTLLQIVYLIFLWRIENKVKRSISTIICLYFGSDLIFWYLLFFVGVRTGQNKFTGLAFSVDNLTYNLALIASITITTLAFTIPAIEKQFWPHKNPLESIGHYGTAP